MAAMNVFYFYLLTTCILNNYHVQSILPPIAIVKSSEAPFMVYVRDRSISCGGVILNERIVLTASHCFSERSTWVTLVTAGACRKSFDVNRQTVNVQKKLSHENYWIDPNGIQAYNDIGLLLLQTPLTFNSYVQPIEWTNIVDFDKPALVYGWGSTHAVLNQPSFRLLAKNISLIPDDLCIEMLNRAQTRCNKQVYELCGRKGVCRGDSGGACVQIVDNVTKLIGITSWAADDNVGCDTEPAIFENVGYFSDWIKDGIRMLMKWNITGNLTDQENAVE